MRYRHVLNLILLIYKKSSNPIGKIKYSAFQVASGMAPEMADRGRAKVAAELAVLTPQEDEAILRAAGFSDVRMFYMGFAFRGWVATAC